MVAWQIFAVIGLICIVLEILVPTMFFLNFALGAFITAGCSLYIHDWTILTIIFVATSLVSILLLRPLLIKSTKKSQETGINAKYIGKTATVIETVTQDNGAITLYDERWQARADHEIPVGAKVEIIKNESLIMYVKERT